MSVFFKTFSPTLHRLMVKIASVFLILTAVIYSLYWYTIATKLKENLPLLIQNYIGDDFNFGFEEIKVNGYPGNFHIIFTKPGLTGQVLPLSNLDVSWNWKGSRAVVQVKVWDLNNPRVDLSGKHTILINVPERRYEFIGNISQCIIDAEFNNISLPMLARINATELVFTEETEKKVVSLGTFNFAAERFFPDIISSKTPTLAVRIGVENLNFSTTRKWPLGTAIDRFYTKLQVLGKVMTPMKVQALKRWRDDGGVIEFDSISGHYGPLQFKANGTLALDENLQILAAVSTEIEGFNLMIESLTNSQIIQPFEAAMARMVFNSLATQTTNSGFSKSILPLNIQNGSLMVHHLTLLKIPKIEWEILQKNNYGSRAPN